MNKIPPIVSVIIPVYNAGDCLNDCLNSVLAQTLSDIEIICVLDCPTDGSDKVVKQYAQKDARIMIIENPHNEHIGNSRNIGLKAAHGEYVTFCDNDDTMVKDFLETMVCEAQKTQALFVGSYDTYINLPELPQSLFCQTKEAYKSVFGGKSELYSPSVWTYMYQRDFLLKNNIFFVDTRYVAIEDRLFNTMVLACGIRMHYETYPQIRRHLYLHKTEHTNGSYDYRKMENILAMLEKMGEIDLLLEQNNRSVEQYNVPYTECIAIFLYGAIKKEIRFNGLCNAIRKLHLIKNYPLVQAALRTYKYTYNTHITPPKNILLLILKTIFI